MLYSHFLHFTHVYNYSRWQPPGSRYFYQIIQRAKGSGNLEDKFNGGHLSGFYSKLEEVLNEHSDEDTLVREVERLLVDRGERSGTAPSTNYHSAIFCNFSFELIKRKHFSLI